MIEQGRQRACYSPCVDEPYLQEILRIWEKSWFAFTQKLIPQSVPDLETFLHVCVRRT